MALDIYQVDAFIGENLRGNPAAVIPLDTWLEDRDMQAIAEENNLSETAFFVKEGNHFKLRWFTPTIEVNLCGHATLASAFVLFNQLNYNEDEIIFETKGGQLKIKKEDDLIIMDFPADEPLPCEAPPRLSEALGKPFKECLKGKYHLVLYRRENEVAELKPDFNLLSNLGFNIIVTAKSDNCDFVSRFFAPASGINEDPVTGSAHTILTPFWSKRLEKHQLLAKQISPRGGLLHCGLNEDRVSIAGRAKLFMKGQIYI